ncbi:MAG: hypothetical protein Q4C57_08440 [Bacillota bacterium]|nr:hypothetical protein [Bacillota bacterium]
MYYVPDGTQVCGYYECSNCKSRFLSVKVAPQQVCPYCGEEPDMEIGPDEEMPAVIEAAKLLQVVSGEEEVEKMDMLLSLAITGGNYDWL